ncbi:MAG: AAA family ATPase [Nitrococcus sp.]|nr:AAA family ATPase [Nitrococcus sp.]
MRFAALSLLRYGRFTDRELGLPCRECDFHVIYGPNEAGKSTCQSAVGDLLFGIPTQTSLNFLHANKDLRIAATLEREGETRRVFRRKGNKDTLLDEASNPLAETVLDAFLGGADRRFFERMFSLDHRRLEEGGQEILAAEGHVGQTLFAAGAGLSGLHQILRRLDQEADALWAPRASKKRTYYAAEDRLKEARQRLREASVAVKSWKDLIRKAEAIGKSLESAREALADADGRKARAERIRRVLPHLTTLRQYQEELAALGEISPLPEDASEQLRQFAEQQIREQTRFGGIERQLAEARDKITGIVSNEAILSVGKEIDSLAQERSLVEQARRKRPGKEAELCAAYRKVQHLSRGLGWENTEPASILARLPALIRRDDLRARIDGHDKCHRDRTEAHRRQMELEREGARVDAKLRALGTTGEGDELATALSDAQRLGNPEGQVGEWQTRRERLAQELQESLAGLPGWRGSPDDLATLSVPARAAIETHRDALDTLAGQIENIARQKEAEESRLQSLQLDREQALRDGQAIPRETLAATREERNGYWQSIRARWLEQTPPEPSAPTNEALAECLAAALNEADEVADRRFENAEAAAALAKIDRDIERTQAAIAQSERRRGEVATEREHRQAEWLACWQDTYVTPGSPVSMLEWLDRRDRLLDLRRELTEMNRQAESLRGQMRAHRVRLEMVLYSLGAPDMPKSASFAGVLERAGNVLGQIRDARAQKRQLDAQRQELAERLADATQQAQEADTSYKRWCEGFTAALGACDLDRGLGLDAAKGALQTLGDLADQVASVERLREDIAQDSQVIATFGERVERLSRELGSDARDQDPVGAAQRLSEELTKERQKRLKRQDEVQRIERLEEDIKQAREALEQADARITRLCATAGAKDIAGLNEVIRRDMRARSLRETLQEASKAALQAGDGKSLEELQTESADAEVDRLIAEISGLDQVITARRQELNELSADLRDAESELKRLGGGERAAIAENERQQALSDMGEAVQGYAWKRGAAMLLRWSLDRYRREKQGPLLSRAGELFRVLTLGAFDHLEVDFDEQDRPELTGLRASGERVWVSGMSDGTADQLYFALRVAAIEEYLDKAPGLPFVADDLFINFDDARAVAGLKILAALSRRTQVLFFTHHAHLVELAERSVHGALPRVYL